MEHSSNRSIDWIQLGDRGPKYLDQLAEKIRRINQANGWEIVHLSDWIDSDYKVPALLALLHSEVSEALEDFRRENKEHFLEELADVQIRLLDLAGGLTPDFTRYVETKLKKNETRGPRHGGKRV